MSATQLLNQIERLLSDQIPNCVFTAKIREPIYALIVRYCDNNSYGSERTPQLMLVKESWRKQVLADSEKCSDPAYFLWSHDELHDQQKAIICELSDPQLNSLCQEWYAEQYSVANESLSAEEALEPMRKLCRRVCQSLNQIEWTEYALVTDDFVVFPADGSHTFLEDGEDLMVCIPPDKLAILQSRGFMPSF